MISLSQHRRFLRATFHYGKQIASIAPSSPYLARAMIAPIDFVHGRIFIELGAWDGAITRYILERMHPQARLYVFEIHEGFCEELSKIDDARLTVIRRGAESAVEVLTEYAIGAESVDACISGLPLLSFPDDLRLAILTAAHTLLKRGGIFTQMNYFPLHFSSYKQVFGAVRIGGFTAWNLPPAFVLMMTKNRELTAAEK